MHTFQIQCMVSKLNLQKGDEIVVVPLFKHHPHGRHFTQHVNLQHIYENASIDQKKYFKEYVKPFQSEQLPEDYKVLLEQPYTKISSSGELWKIGFPFSAHYNNYGGFYLKNTQKHQLGLNILINTIKNQGITADKSNFEYSKINFDPQTLDNDIMSSIEKIQEVAWEEQLFIVDELRADLLLYPQSYTAVTFAYIEKNVYEFMLQNMTDRKKQFSKNINHHLKHVIPFLEHQANYYYSLENNLHDTLYSFEQMRLLEEKQHVSHITTHSDGSFNFHYNIHHFSPKKYMEETEVNNCISYHWKENGQSQYKQILVLKSQIYLINYYLSFFLYQNWEPLRITGHNVTNEVRLHFNEIIAQIAQNKN